MKNNLTLEDKDNQVILRAYKKLLRHSKSIISKNDSNIQSVATKTLDEHFTELTAKLIVRDIQHLELIKSQLKNNKTVTNIERQQT